MRRKKDKSNGITALYERLSRDDDNAGESNSIVHQKQMLEDYAIRHGFTNLVHFTDDGWSGATFDRPSWNRLIEGVKNGEITACICKDMSRIGRDHLQVGFFTDILFREKEVRFIAINNGIDSDRQETSEFAPFLNIMNEWFVRDTSKKIKAVLKSRGSSGNAHTSNIPPYGYLKDPENPDHYVSLNEQEFVYSLQEESAMKDIAVSETVKKRIERNQKRVHELDMLIRKIYEDNVIGRLPDRLFQSMLTDYENEQNELNKIIETDTADMQRIIGGQNNVERFLKLVKKYENITELTPAMINEFIDKILVHEPQGKGADRTTEVEIYLNYVGQFQVPVEQHEPTEEERIAAEKEADRLRRKRESNRKYMKKIREKSKKFAEHERIAEEKSSDSKLCAEQNATSKSNRQKVKGEKIA